MARRWRWFCGWEHGGLRRLGSPEAVPQQGTTEADTWDAPTDIAFDLTAVRTGKYAWKSAGGGLGTPADTTGDVEARAQQWLYACGGFALRSFNIPANLSVGDAYAIARVSKKFNTGANKYLAICIQITNLTGPKFKFRVARMNSDGMLDALLGTQGSTEFGLGTTFRWVVLEMDTTNNNYRLLVDGSEEIGSTAYKPVLNNVDEEPYMMHDDRLVSDGKAVEAGLRVSYDDFGTCDDSAQSPPGTTTEVELYQPNGVVQDAWPSAKYCDVDDENDADLPDTDDVDTNKITPTVVNQQQTFTFPDNAGGTIEAVRIVYGGETTIDGKEHDILAITDGVSLTKYSGPQKGGGDGYWWGKNLSLTPEGDAWTTGLFNQLEAGLEAGDLDSVGEFYIMVIGTSLTRPSATASGACAAVGRRRLAQVI
ncbi:hypothetical protein LCGC14_1529770 [marine sediment metagenome]|uniref:Uncharacterized protein n=1 Tax=marine sediment metagenome TaxID=412755 RepID=A0A0F9IW55_9ZZZZ